MNGCQTCGGFGMHHDAVAHGEMRESDEPCMCDTDFTCMADEHDHAVIATTAPSGDEQGERAHGDGTTAPDSVQGDSGGRA